MVARLKLKGIDGRAPLRQFGPPLHGIRYRDGSFDHRVHGRGRALSPTFSSSTIVWYAEL